LAQLRIAKHPGLTIFRLPKPTRPTAGDEVTTVHDSAT
jgi:hypothetical protein